MKKYFAYIVITALLLASCTTPVENLPLGTAGAEHRILEMSTESCSGLKQQIQVSQNERDNLLERQRYNASLDQWFVGLSLPLLGLPILFLPFTSDYTDEILRANNDIQVRSVLAHNKSCF